jgi:hypothetical protein
VLCALRMPLLPSHRTPPVAFGAGGQPAGAAGSSDGSICPSTQRGVGGRLADGIGDDSCGQADGQTESGTWPPTKVKHVRRTPAESHRLDYKPVL